MTSSKRVDRDTKKNIDRVESNCKKDVTRDDLRVTVRAFGQAYSTDQAEEEE
jgi:hypothetical protein